MLPVLQRLRQILSRRDPLTIAVGAAVGIATYYFVSALVGSLIAPLIAAFVGDQHFELNSFSINGSEFRYGIAIEYALTFALVGALALLSLSVCRRVDADQGSGADEVRSCPECTRAIPFAAKRCPYCTASLSTAESG
jgi:large conductance mechanosensitive channel